MAEAAYDGAGDSCTVSGDDAGGLSGMGVAYYGANYSVVDAYGNGCA